MHSCVCARFLMLLSLFAHNYSFHFHYWIGGKHTRTGTGAVHTQKKTTNAKAPPETLKAHMRAVRFYA